MRLTKQYQPVTLKRQPLPPDLQIEPHTYRTVRLEMGLTLKQMSNLFRTSWANLERGYVCTDPELKYLIITLLEGLPHVKAQRSHPNWNL